MLRIILIFLFNRFYLRGARFLQTQLLCVLREVFMVLRRCDLTLDVVI